MQPSVPPHVMAVSTACCAGYGNTHVLVSCTSLFSASISINGVVATNNMGGGAGTPSNSLALDWPAHVLHYKLLNCCEPSAAGFVSSGTTTIAGGGGLHAEMQCGTISNAQLSIRNVTAAGNTALAGKLLKRMLIQTRTLCVFAESVCIAYCLGVRLGGKHSWPSLLATSESSKCRVSSCLIYSYYPHSMSWWCDSVQTSIAVGGVFGCVIGSDSATNVTVLMTDVTASHNTAGGTMLL
jgi:hypothetical protein